MSRENRAVSAWFRVFGASEDRGYAHRAGCPGMHRGEMRFLSVLVPVVVAAALGEQLATQIGAVITTLFILPLAWIVTQLLSIGMGFGGTRVKWCLWQVVLIAWAWWRAGQEGWGAWVACGVLVLAAANALAASVLVWRAMLALSGKAGLAFRAVVVVLLHAGLIAALCLGHWLAAALVFALIGAVFCGGTLRPNAEWFGPVISKHKGKGVLITIDDGPDPNDTPKLLEILDRHQAKAVFFVIGEKVKKYPELARMIVERGHELGNHTMTHPQASFWSAGPWRTRREIAQCQQAIEETTGVKPRWFRAPVGHRTWSTHPITREQGMEVMAWSHRGYDAVRTDVPQILAQMLEGIGDGDILLMHEATPIAEEVMRGVLAGLEERGIILAGVHEVTGAWCCIS